MPNAPTQRLLPEGTTETEARAEFGQLLARFVLDEYGVTPNQLRKAGVHNTNNVFKGKIDPSIAVIRGILSVANVTKADAETIWHMYAGRPGRDAIECIQAQVRKRGWAAVAETAGISKWTLQSYLRGTGKMKTGKPRKTFPSFEKWQQIADALNITGDLLMLWKEGLLKHRMQRSCQERN